MARLGHLEGELRQGHAVPARADGRREDVHVGVRQHPRDVREQPGPVQRLDLDLHEEQARLPGGHRRGPLHVDDALGFLAQGHDVLAVLAVHRDPGAAGDEPDDRVVRHGCAALGELDPHVVGPGDDDAGLTAAAAGTVAARGGRLGEVLLDGGLPADGRDELVDDVLGRDVPLPHRGVQRGDVGVVQLAGDDEEGVVRQQALQRQVLLAHGARDLVLALLDRLLAALLGEVLLDLVARPGALDEGQPVPAGRRPVRLGGEDLDEVAVVEGGVERDEPAVDPAPIVRCPTSVWTAYAKSIGVEPAGNCCTSPLGVNTKTWFAPISQRRSSRKSPVADSRCQSTTDFSQSISVCGRVPAATALGSSLYFQCAATPYSARWCIVYVRIWISTGLPSGR